MQTTTYTLPAHWACALINADCSGMDDDEIAAMNDWLSAYRPGSCVDCSEDPEFCHSHDADGYALAGDCLTFTFTNYEEIEQ
jgi:hypothetical protein